MLPGTVNKVSVLLLGSLGSLQPIALHPSTVLGTILPFLLFIVVVALQQLQHSQSAAGALACGFSFINHSCVLLH